ncbi:MAG: hypothetical protein WAM44_07205 [Chthoniobacterales bacterium]
MLDGNRYYAEFPDEDPELRPRITAVLQALGKVERRPHWTSPLDGKGHARAYQNRRGKLIPRPLVGQAGGGRGVRAR